ncbi:ubinuclein-1 isoform X2 [Coccinella septempunctata]|nr:ubinuclein-1 isoform X2 [Coccinella septempunctata]
MLDDDDDVRRIALEMEEKYGKGTSSVAKKKHKGRKDDYADIGMGYDESDSFIDNTDGYDEIIPQHVTTLHGGFYVNAGALEFKTDDEESEESSNEDSTSSGQSRKRSLDSDGSEEDEAKPRQSKKMKIDPKENGMQKALKKKLFSPNKILKKKRTQNIHKKTVSELLKEKRKDLNLTGNESEVRVDQEKGEVKKHVENGKLVSNSINDAIESVVKASEENVGKVEKISSQAKDATVKPAPLPENLPKNILQVIHSIKEKGSNSKDGDKFTKEINHLLTSLERKSKFLGKPSKYKVYENLSYYLKVEKQVLIQHCNQLALKDDQHKIESLLRQLKTEIDKVMPSIIQNYERECELVIERRNLLQLQNHEGDEKRVKSIGRPKRKFQWNDNTRKLLKDTATVKKRSFLNQNNSIDSWEEELLTFLKNKVIHLWPEGWMTMTALTKVCNKLFNEPNTANQPSSSKKESNKITAINTPSLPFPNLSITPVMNNVPSSRSTPKTSPTEGKPEKMNNHPVESFQKDYTKENIPREHNHKEKRKEEHSDKKNNNADTFFKVDYDKVKPVQSSSKPVDLVKDAPESAKLPNVSIIEIDGPTDFSNLLPKTKFASKNDHEISKVCNKLNATGEGGSHRAERTLIVNDHEVTMLKPEENQLNLTDGDDIQKVMEHLKTLQQMSSPVKPFEGSSYSNSGYTPKTSGLTKNNLVNSSFQDEYQKQLLNALGNLSASQSKSNYKCS